MSESAKRKAPLALIFTTAWFTYLCAYLCRVNFSSALASLSSEKGISEDMLGVIGALFFGIYALGQLVNGYLGDKVRANRFIICALSGTMLCNLSVSFANRYWLILLLWGLNGCFQSMFWCTIIRILAQSIDESKRAAISSGISLAMPCGYLVSWGILGRLLDGRGARLYFLIPAVMCLPLLGTWLYISQRYRFENAPEAGNKNGIIGTFRYLEARGLIIVIPICLLHGLIKEGVAYWTPLLMHSMGFTGWFNEYTAVCILPVSNLIGITISKKMLNRNAGKPFRILVVFMGFIALAALGLEAKNDGLFMIALMALISGLCYANNTVLLSFIPMQYVNDNMVSSLIGVFDFASYLGAALSTYALGRILASLGFKPLPFIWLGAALVAIVLSSTLFVKQHKKR